MIFILSVYILELPLPGALAKLSLLSNTNSDASIDVMEALGNGTSSLTFGTSGGNANISIGGTSNVLVVANTSTNFAGNLLPTSNVTYSLGSTTNRWKDLWVSNSTDRKSVV